MLNARFSDTPPNPPGILVRGLDLDLGGHRIFQSFNLDAAAGACTAILGPSGIGKTSLLRAIAGQIPAVSPHIHDTEGLPLNGRIAWMAQKDLLLPWLSVLNNVMLGARLRGQRLNPHRAMAWLAAVGLEKRANDRPDALSGGMRQRVALARTLMEDRPVILMDEPFSAVDPLTRIRLQNLAANVLAGRTVVLVTHDPLEALRLGHRVVVLNGSPVQAHDITIVHPDWPRPMDAPEVLAAQGHILRALSSGATP